MRSIKIENDTVRAARYTLKLDRECATASVVLSGNEIVRLDLRSAVNTLDGENNTVCDCEPNRPEFIGEGEESGKYVFRFKGKSSLWDEKEYIIRCDSQRFSYGVKVKGRGRVDSVNYYSGNISDNRHGSEYEFSEGFNPCISWYDTEDYYFKASVKNSRWAVLMTPPMFCYAFRTEGIGEQLAFGVVAERGEHNFHSVTYNPTSCGMGSRFYLSTDQHGHTEVNGEWEAPRMISYGAPDEFEVMRLYSEYYFTGGIAEPKNRGQYPRFWRGPLVCGWIGQRFEAGRPGAKDPNPGYYANQTFYEQLCDKMKKYGLHPTALIIDDKWQTTYGVQEVDTEKWRDMRGFIDARHKDGIKTLLWFRLWATEGLDDSLTVKDQNGDIKVDPSNPEFLGILDETIYKLVSSDPGCCNCDGFKLDFAFCNPIGRNFKTYSGKYGAELLYEYQKHIYDTVKKIKPDALINCSPCHPYFAHICDQARLHDYVAKNRNNYEDLEFRGRMFSLSNPGVLLDTDNAGFSSRRDSMRYLMGQPNVGVPDLYAIEECEAMTETDIFALAEMWDEYSAKIDAEYSINN